MLSLPPVFTKSLKVLHRFPVVIVIAFLLEGSLLFTHLGGIGSRHPESSVFLVNMVMPLLRALFFIVQVYGLAGLLGHLVELANEEELTFVHHNFMISARQFAKDILGVLLIPIAAHFLFFALLPSTTIHFSTVFSGLSPLLAYLIARQIIKKKYLSGQKIQDLRWRARPPDAVMLILLYIINFLIVPLSNSPSKGALNLNNVFFFMTICFQLIAFIYITCLILDQIQPASKTDSRKELYLIQPPSGGILAPLMSILSWHYPPWFVVLRALTPPEYKIRTFSRPNWKDSDIGPGKLVAISCFTSNSAEAYAIAKAFKRSGSKVVMGGPHVTFLEDEALEFCDSVVTGEAEGVWPQVLRDYEQNCLKPKYAGFVDEPSDHAVHQQLLKDDVHIAKYFVQTTRGCKFDCDFCTIPGLSRVREKPLAEVIELAQKIKRDGKGMITFLDNNIYTNPAYTRKLFEALIPLKIRWAASSSIDLAKNKEVLRLAKESGCAALLIGYEVIEDSLESLQGGKMSMARQYRALTRDIQKAGIVVKGHFIFGFESNTLRSLGNLWKFCFQLRPAYTCVTLLTPLPGSKLYHRLLSENRILNLNWRHYNCENLVFRHPHLKIPVTNVLIQIVVFVFFLTTSSYGQAILIFIALGSML